MTDPRKIAEDIEAGGGATVEQRRTLARAYLEMLPPESAWSHDEGDVVLTHPDGSTERFYAGERAPFIVAACSRYEALGGAADRLRRTGGPWFEGIPDSDRDAAYADWLAARAEEEERG